MEPGRISVLKPWDLRACYGVNVTSKSSTVYSDLSPFFLGPVSLYGQHYAMNVENAWQFSKVYSMHHDFVRDEPNDDYYTWATIGWRDQYAHRYPMGKGAVPLYSWWDGVALDYVTARKEIYVPLYREAVLEVHPHLLDSLVEYVAGGDDLVIHDFDAYDHRSLGMSLNDVLNDATKKMGHGFVLAMMIEEKLYG